MSINKLFILLVFVIISQCNIASAASIPSIVVESNKNPTLNISLYVSPTGRYSFTTFKYVFTHLVKYVESTSNARLAAHFVPRNPDEVDVMHLLTCVPQEQFDEYAIRVLSENKPGQKMKTVTDIEKIGAEYGLNGKTLKDCKTVEGYVSQIGVVKYLKEKHGVNRAAAWVINEKAYTDIYFLWQMKEVLKNDFGIDL